MKLVTTKFKSGGLHEKYVVAEMKSVYSAVRTGSLNNAVCASSVKG